MTPPVRDTTRHQSRTDRGTMKLRCLANNVVFERQPPDAANMVETGDYAYVDMDEPSAVEAVSAMPADRVGALLRTTTEPNHNFDGDARTVLLRMIEAGTVTLS